MLDSMSYLPHSNSREHISMEVYIKNFLESVVTIETNLFEIHYIQTIHALQHFEHSCENEAFRKIHAMHWR